MRLANNISVRVFCKEDVGRDAIVAALRKLFPFSLEEEKVKLSEETAKGFEDRKILIFSVFLKKERHIHAFLDALLANLGKEKKTLDEQAQSRLDNELNFFIRLDKEMLLKGRYVLTDSGSCYHIKINLAAFPKKRERGLAILHSLLTANNIM